MTPSELLQEKREEILRLCAKYRARNVRVFGSAGRAEAGAQSDIDLLVEFEPGHGRWMPALIKRFAIFVK